jgi:putative endonuclease
VADLIRKKGYRIVQKNYQCAIGEIDLIAEEAGRLHFIEVKTRSGRGFGDPAEAVDLRKQKKLIKLAEWYLKDKRMKDVPVSFDVAAVVWREDKDPEVRLIENAFEKSDEAS